MIAWLARLDLFLVGLERLVRVYYGGRLGRGLTIGLVFLFDGGVATVACSSKFNIIGKNVLCMERSWTHGIALERSQRSLSGLNSFSLIM